ncbi:MAG: hypothetical protein MUC79_09190 [Thiobacillaceae bacterium]|jgi:hypothetical protein|nr:hypothetical protein [Thiobacillaceae bacterium]
MSIGRTLLWLALGLTALEAAANDGWGGWVRGDSPTRLAQWSADERRAQRERWDSLPADDRAALQQDLRDRLRDLPPEERERRRREIMDAWRDLPADERDARTRQRQERRDAQPWPAMEGFGRGYERRVFPPDRPEVFRDRPELPRDRPEVFRDRPELPRERPDIPRDRPGRR